MMDLVGATVSHYKILSQVGQGGMGVVYRAEDLKLTRTVALKFLLESLVAHEPQRERFLDEARAAGILNHPNICTIHDIQEYEGQQFIVMEYVEGKTLREVVPVRKIQDAIGYALQIGEALHEAHTHGIVHRDIKADNIMVNTKNQVKVMDFGYREVIQGFKFFDQGEYGRALPHFQRASEIYSNYAIAYIFLVWSHMNRFVDAQADSIFASSPAHIGVFTTWVPSNVYMQ